MTPSSTSLPAWLTGNGRRFEPGNVSISMAAQEALRASRTSVESLIARHCSCDFGELSEADRHTCEVNLLAEGYVTSVYSVAQFPMGLGKAQIWAISLLRERWTYLCVQSEIANIY
jgi:hypothetical protein